MTRPQWSADLEVSPELAAQLISEQFPRLSSVRVQWFGAGWDNVALRVNERYVFRFPRRTLGAALLESELKLMPAIAPLLSLPVSNPIFVGRPTERFRWSFAGYELIPGIELCRAHLTEAQRRGPAASLGAFLRVLHSIPTDHARQHGAGPDQLRRLDVPHRAAQIAVKLAYLREHGLFDRVDALRAIIESVPQDYRARSDVLVHGDLYSLHVIVDDAGALAGVIDWGDVHLGDPATDLMAAWIMLPPAARKDFLCTYGQVDDLTWLLARFRALNHTCNVIPYAHQKNDADLLRECRLCLSWLTEA